MEEIIRVRLVILPWGAVKSLRIYTSAHSDVVIKKKTKLNGTMDVLHCAACGSHLGHMVLVPSLHALLEDTNQRAESFPDTPAVWKSTLSWAV